MVAWKYVMRLTNFLNRLNNLRLALQNPETPTIKCPVRIGAMTLPTIGIGFERLMNDEVSIGLMEMRTQFQACRDCVCVCVCFVGGNCGCF